MPTAFVHPWQYAGLIRILTWRDISGRYRGSLLGGLWALLTPLLMLAVFTFVFGVVAPTRWPGAEAQGMGMFALLLLGLCWLLAALGVYLRDLNQLVGPLVMVCMFLGPVFYPRQAMPALAQPWLALNPITIPVEQIRRVLFDSQWPDGWVLAQYSVVSVAVYLFGLWAFTRFKKGFADVL